MQLSNPRGRSTTLSVPTPRRASWLAISVLILFLGMLRLVHLEADTPRQVTRFSVGVFVDEGYKTLSPRNLVLYGQEKWNSADQYRGWMDNSPLTQWPFLISFKALGVELGSARVATIAWSMILLLAFAYGLRERYEPRLLLLGMILLGLAHLLFFFSRIALFEIPICVSIYLGLFILARWEHRHPIWSLAAIILLAVGATLFIKQSAGLYATALLLGLSIGALYRRSPSKGALLRVGLPAAVVLVWLGILTFDEWMARMSLDFGDVLLSNYLNPMSFSPVFLVCAGLFCVIQAVSSDSRLLLESPYRAGLLGLVIVGPILLSLFGYNPLRYYVPLLPAYILLILEWLHLSFWKKPQPEGGSLVLSAIGVLLSSLLVFQIGQSINFHLLFRLPINLGETPGVSERFFHAHFFPWIFGLSLGLGAAIWFLRKRVLSGWIALLIFSFFLGLAVLRDSVMLGSFYLDPSHQSREIAEDLERIVPVDGSIAGDWAPFLTLGTHVRAIYMFRSVNPPSHLVDLRPSHFLYSDTLTSNEHISLFENETRVRLGEPLYRSSYVGRTVVLYPIVFDDLQYRDE